MSCNREQTNDSNVYCEQKEGFLEKLGEIPEKAVREHILKECQDDYAAVDLDCELSEKEKSTIANTMAEVPDLIAYARKFNILRKFLQKGIKLKGNAPDSELFKTTKEALCLVDQIEGNISSATNYQLLKFKSLFVRYTELLRAELERPTETKQISTPPKRGGLAAILWKFYEKTLGVIVEKILEKMSQG